MKCITHLVAVGAITVVFSACQGKQGGQTEQGTQGTQTQQEEQAMQSAPAVQPVKLLPEIIFENIPFQELSKHPIETVDNTYSSEDTPIYYVTNPEGTYVYAKPDTNALKVKTFYPGDMHWVDKVSDQWGRVVFSSITIGEAFDFLVGYVQLQSLSTKWQDIPLHGGMINQVSSMSFPEGEELYRAPHDRRFFELDGYAQVELIDQDTYEAAAKVRVEQFVVDTLIHRKQDGKITLPTKKGPYIFEDNRIPEYEEDGVNHTYLGRVSPQGPYVVHTNYYEGYSYRLIDPQTGKTLLEDTYMAGYPFLSPKGDYIISVSEDYMGDAAEVYIIKVMAYGGYALHGVLYYPFWHPYGNHHEARDPESEYWNQGTQLLLPDSMQFWSKDNYFYIRIRPFGYWYKQVSEADPYAYYARIKILPSKTLK